MSVKTAFVSVWIVNEIKSLDFLRFVHKILKAYHLLNTRISFYLETNAGRRLEYVQGQFGKKWEISSHVREIDREKTGNFDGMCVCWWFCLSYTLFIFYEDTRSEDKYLSPKSR